MKKWHIIVANLILLSAILALHIIIVLTLIGYIPYYGEDFQKIVRNRYPLITVEWHPQIGGGGGGASIFDLTLPLMAFAFAINIVALAMEKLHRTEIKVSG